MREMSFSQAADDALAQAMAEDTRIIVFGEDVPAIRRDLYVRFGKERVRGTPISEGAFVGAAVTAAMGGLHPVVEVMLVDFIGVAMDAVLNQAAKVEAFSGGRWHVPMVVRAACGGGYGDGGQHEQSLWGWLAHIPGLRVVVPSDPADAGGLMLSALRADGPVVYLEHKLLAEPWLELMGTGRRSDVSFDVPPQGARGTVPDKWEALEMGKARIRREGNALTVAAVGVDVHRALQAAAMLEARGVSAAVIDLRSVSPLDHDTICRSVAATGRLLVVDEDYEAFGLSGELAAIVAEAGIRFRFARVCTAGTIPYAHDREIEVLPNVRRIVEAAARLVES